MDIVTVKRVRITLAIFSSALSVILGIFMWIMLDASSDAMSSVLLSSLALVVGVTVVAQIIYALNGQIFEFDGRLAKQEVLFAIICFQVIMQFSFGFSLYAVKQTELQNTSVDSTYAYFIELQQSAADNTIAAYRALDLEANMPECVESILLVDDNDPGGIDQYFRFPVSGGRLLMKKSPSYFIKRLQEFAVTLLMSLVISVLLMAELVYLAIKYMDTHNDSASVNPVYYLRQIAFLFYFTGYLGSSFIPILAHNLSGDNPNADFIAGLPYSVEALANCFAILLTVRIFQRRGWKPSYALGVSLFIAGLVASALSPNVYLLIASRAVTGAGYGFCWMTLRNITTLSGDRIENFSSLSSGIYAGIMCGVAFGTVLADTIGFRNVLLVSAGLSVMVAVFPMTLRNYRGSAAPADGNTIKLSARYIVLFTVFLVMIVIPTCISDAFCAYVLPLYINKLHFPTAYIGRVSLIYNLCFVYISSTLLIKLAKNTFKNKLFANALHMLVISLALFAVAFLGGFQAVIIAAALLGSADGFGFSVQNTYVLETQVSKKIGVMRMLTWFSLFKKFGAILGPIVFGLFIMNGFKALGVMGLVFIICAMAGVLMILFLQKNEVNR